MCKVIFLFSAFFITGCASVFGPRPSVFKDCYNADSSLTKIPDSKVLLSWVVGSDGHPKDVKVKETTLKNTKVETCLVEAVQKQIFPKPPEGQEADVVFPVRFKSGVIQAVGKPKISNE
jgi:hypothetical protein